MSNKRQANQGGLVTRIVIIGVILALVLVGSVYYLNKRGDQIRKDQAIAAADKQTQEAEKSKTVVSSNKSNTTTKNESSSVTTTIPEALPVTGPETSINSLIAVYLLTFAVTGYVTSRRQLVRYL